MSDYDYDPFEGTYYKRHEKGGFVVIMILLAICVIVAIIFTVLYFTCTAPFGGSDSCKCTKSKGTYKDGKCTCTSPLELVGGQCVNPCKTNELRDSSGTCVACATGKLSNGLSCVDDLNGNWMGYITSTNTAVPGYNWNIQHTGAGVSIYSGTTLKVNTTFDGSTIMWGAVKGTWNASQKRITWSNDSHWIKQ